MVLSAAASITKNIKLNGAAVTVLSSEPVKVYQDFSTLDLISGGRAEMVSVESFIESFPLLVLWFRWLSRTFEKIRFITQNKFPKKT